MNLSTDMTKVLNPKFKVPWNTEFITLRKVIMQKRMKEK